MDKRRDFRHSLAERRNFRCPIFGALCSRPCCPCHQMGLPTVAVVVVLTTITMQNEEGKMVDLYVPRKW
jgi:hypothetical protein